jgi:PDZ domain-containing secreted protein
MSDREKKLLALLLFAGFVILNFFLFTLYSQAKLRYAGELETAKSDLQQAITISESSEEFAGEMEWLAANEPEPAAYQDVQTKLQLFAESQARNLGLTVKSQELLPTDKSGTHYHRAQVKISLSGSEKALYEWFSQINDPAAFRTAYQIVLKPNSQDETQIECSATLSQWFPPAL